MRPYGSSAAGMPGMVKRRVFVAKGSMVYTPLERPFIKSMVVAKNVPVESWALRDVLSARRNGKSQSLAEAVVDPEFEPDATTDHVTDTGRDSSAKVGQLENAFAPLMEAVGVLDREADAARRDVENLAGMALAASDVGAGERPDGAPITSPAPLGHPPAIKKSSHGR